MASNQLSLWCDSERLWRDGQMCGLGDKKPGGAGLERKEGVKHFRDGGDQLSERNGADGP